MSRDPNQPRILTADREQLRLLPTDIDSTVPEDHRVRDIWRWLDGFDLASFYAKIRARGSDPGRPAIDPKILLCLWVFATSEGVGSARHIDRLCDEHLVYRWICGGVSVNYHTLADFRTGYEEELDEILTEILGVLMKAEVLKLKRVSHDGVRVRASAGAASFRKERTLEKCIEEAERHVEEVKRRAELPDGQLSKREKAARERAARERQERIEKALSELPDVRKAKTKKLDKAKARVSTTDPEARVQKMADGGFRPAYNVQLAVDVESRFIVGAGITNRGSDYGRIGPMLDDIERRTGKLPEEYLVDGGFADHKDMEAAEDRGMTVYAPVPKPRKKKGEPEPDEAERYLPKPGDSERIAAWRVRMSTAEAKEIYKDRAASVETVNADLREHRGFTKFRVRGKRKVLSSTLLAAITYNLQRAISLGVAWPGAG
jgi:transposase